MKVLGIDQSLTCTGWVIMDEDFKVVDSGVIRTTKEDSLPTRCGVIAYDLLNHQRRYEAWSVSIEGLSYGSIGNATRNLAILMGHIQSKLYESESDWLETPATSLKKYATGNGRADKKDMLAAVPDDFRGYLLVNYKGTGKKSGLYDLSDAYFLAKRGIEYFRGDL